MKSNCIFCQVVAGKIPCYKIFENEHFLGLLDIFPVIEGHALIIPKKHYRWVHEVKEFGQFWQVAQKVALAQINGLKASTVVFATAGFQVPHAHIHVMPMPPIGQGEFLPGVESAKRIKVTPQELQKTAASLRKTL